MGWLTDLTNWLSEQIAAFWAALVAFFKDLLVSFVEVVCDFAATVIEAIPVPDFIQTYSLDVLLGNAGPSIAWAVGTFKIGEGLTLIAAGYAFRLLRKAFTLGQW